MVIDGVDGDETACRVADQNVIAAGQRPYQLWWMLKVSDYIWITCEASG